MYNLNMALKDLLPTLRAQIPLLKKKYAVSTLQVFGSYVRQEQTAESDLDLLVDFDEVPSLLEFIALENYLSDIVGIQVDLVMKDSLKAPLDQFILGEAVPV